MARKYLFATHTPQEALSGARTRCWAKFEIMSRLTSSARQKANTAATAASSQWLGDDPGDPWIAARDPKIKSLRNRNSSMGVLYVRAYTDIHIYIYTYEEMMFFYIYYV